MIFKFFSSFLIIFTLLSCQESSNEKSELDKQVKRTVDLLKIMKDLEKAKKDLEKVTKEIETLVQEKMDTFPNSDAKYIRYCDSLIATKKDSLRYNKSQSH
jgi:hypothetical protein